MKHSLICTTDAGREISGSKSNRHGLRSEGIFPIPEASHSGLLRLGPIRPMNCRRLFRSGASVHDFNTRRLWRCSRCSVKDKCDAAREWRTIIKLPKYANSVDGTLALQRLGSDAAQRDEVNRLLAREYVMWQITRARKRATV